MTPLKASVAVVQFVAASATLAFVVLLFVNEPDRADRPDEAGEVDTTGSVDGAAVYADNCARCHGSDGSGGSGPPLSDGQVVARFPDIEDQIAVVTDGRGGMPSFGDDLSAEAIQAVVDYTRTL